MAWQRAIGLPIFTGIKTTRLQPEAVRMTGKTHWEAGRSMGGVVKEGFLATQISPFSDAASFTGYMQLETAVYDAKTSAQAA